MMNGLNVPKKFVDPDGLVAELALHFIYDGLI